MKVTKNEQGKYDIDFEGLEINLHCDMTLGSVQELFNPDTVSEVRNGHFLCKNAP